MIKQRAAMPTCRGTSRREGAESGQLLVVFALALVALVAMVGLILDGGDTFLQRRDQQNVTDAAAMAAGYAAVNGVNTSTAAQGIAATNGYTNGSGGVVVTLSSTPDTYTVTITKPHRNYFSGIVGFTSWNVSTTATVRAGVPNTVYGAMPLIFNSKAFEKAANKTEGTPASFSEPGTGPADVPTTDASFNWTVYCTANGNPCNGNSATIDGLINSNGTTTTVDLTELIGPLNAGAHTTLFSDLSQKVGKAYPVAIVDDTGALVGWAWFHLTGSVGGNTKQISGWFGDKVNPEAMSISPTGGTGSRVYGSYAVDLIN